MKKRILTTLLISAGALACAVGLTACGGVSSRDKGHSSHVYTDWVSVDANTHSGTCSCGQTKVEAHDFQNGYCVKCEREHEHSVSEWEAVDELTHSGTCYATGAHTVTETHTMIDGICSKCDYGSIPVESISFGKTETHLYATQTEQLNVTITPSDATYQTITWTNEFPVIATVDENGLITAKTNGSTVITATTPEGKSCSITVTVCDEDSHGLLFVKNGDAYSVSGVDTDASDITSLVIPSTYNGLPVTAIRSLAFPNNTSIESITLPDSVTEIGRNAFYNCTALTDINIDNVTSFGSSVFYGCESLRSVTLNAALTEIPTNLFENCTSLSEIEIPSTVSTVGSSAFRGCTSLQEIVLPVGVKEVTSYLFYDCTSLKTVDLSNVEIISGRAFYGCSSLANIDIPSTLIAIAAQAFDACSSLEKMTVPSTVESIANNAFTSTCNALTVYVDYADSDSQPIGWGSSWKAPNIPIVYDSKNNSIASDGYIHNVKVGGLQYKVRYNENFSAYEAVIARQPTSLGGDIVLTDTIAYGGKTYDVVGMDSGAFSNTAVESVKFGNSFTDVPQSAFYSCTKLKSVDFGGITTIMINAFIYCSALEKIEITDKITSIKSYAFVGCNGVTEVTVHADNAAYRVEGNCIIDRSTDTVEHGFACSVIPAGVKAIASNAFRNSAITRVVIPSSVTAVSYDAFYDCDQLEELIIEEGVKSIDVAAFEGCNKLESVVLPSSLTTLNANIFRLCSADFTVYCRAAEKPVGWAENWDVDVANVVWGYTD